MGLNLARRTVFLNDDEQDLYRGLPLEPATGPGAVAAAGRLGVDFWFEEPLGADWVVAYRLGLQEQDTRVVVSEIRIFPAVAAACAGDRRWAAECSGAAPRPRPAASKRGRCCGASACAPSSASCRQSLRSTGSRSRFARPISRRPGPNAAAS